MCTSSAVSYAVLGDPRVALAKRGTPDMSALCPYKHCFCSVGRMQPEDLQQPGIRRPPGSVCQPRFRGCLPADAHVHHPHELRQRLGRRVQVSSEGYMSQGPGVGTAEQGLLRDKLGSPRLKSRDQGSERGHGLAGWGWGRVAPDKEELAQCLLASQFFTCCKHTCTLTITLG